MEKYYKITTYGCQMNVHESEKLAGVLEKLGYTATQDTALADIIVFNTCAIRENAEEHAYGNIGALKSYKKKKPSLIIAVLGCMTQQNGAADRLHQKFPWVDIIFGTYNLGDFESFVIRKQNTKKTIIEILDKEREINENMPTYRTSYPNGWVNIMEGCNNFCTYCIVPYVKGRERSRLPENIYNEVKDLVNDGYKEITLLGQNVNSYGKDLENPVTFANLLRLLCTIEGKFRLRFMTNHPKDFSKDVIDVMVENAKICKCIHLPVQAGNDRVLKVMNRKYTSADYLEKLSMLRAKIPDCTVTTDLMVGFPTETEEEFLDTLKLVEKANFSNAFTFIYSRRKGTIADTMDGQVDEEVKKDRIKRLIELQNSITKKQSLNYKDKIVEVLCEGFDDKKDKYLGRDEYGRMVYFSSNNDVIGNFVNVKINKTGGVSLYGEMV